LIRIRLHFLKSGGQAANFEYYNTLLASFLLLFLHKPSSFAKFFPVFYCFALDSQKFGKAAFLF